MWSQILQVVQGNHIVATSWSGLVALLAPHLYNGRPLFSAHKTRQKRYILLDTEINTLKYFNLAVTVYVGPVIIGGTHYKKNH